MSQEQKELEVTTEEVIETDEVVEKDDSEKTYDELKAEAEAAERLAKESKNVDKEDELKKNMIIRRDKALAKAGSQSVVAKSEPKEDTLDVRDLLALDKAGIPEDSEKAKVLESYRKAGFIKNYAEGMLDSAIKAKFAEIDANLAAKTVIDENFSDDETMRTKKEVVIEYRKKGEIPNDPQLRDVIVQDNLKRMNI